MSNENMSSDEYEYRKKQPYLHGHDCFVGFRCSKRIARGRHSCQEN